MQSLQTQRAHVQKELLVAQKLASAAVNPLKGSEVKQEYKRVKSERGVAARDIVRVELSDELQSAPGLHAMCVSASANIVVHD